MKTLYYILSIAALAFLSACSKDELAKPTENPVAVAKPLPDSLSFKINGSSYGYNSIWSYRVGNADAHRKIDSVINYSYYSSGNKDSVFLYRSFDFTTSISVSFCKIYAKKGISNNFGILVPANNIQDLFAQGKRNFVADFGRENAHNGVAIKIGQIGQSFTFDEIYHPNTFKPYAPGEANFEVISYKKDAASNKITVEAKFDLTVYDKNLQPTRITDGFLRLRFSQE